MHVLQVEIKFRLKFSIPFFLGWFQGWFSIWWIIHQIENQPWFFSYFKHGSLLKFVIIKTNIENKSEIMVLNLYLPSALDLRWSLLSFFKNEINRAFKTGKRLSSIRFFLLFTTVVFHKITMVIKCLLAMYVHQSFRSETACVRTFSYQFRGFKPPKPPLRIWRS